MGKRRRKLLRRKYAKLSWNVYNKNRAKAKSNEEQEAEQKITKVVDDNSIMLEQMKDMSSSIDKVLQNFDTTMKALAETEPIPVMTVLPTTETKVELKAEPPPIITVKTSTQINLKRKTKKVLVKMARELNCNVKTSDTKANIIRAIEANQ